MTDNPLVFWGLIVPGMVTIWALAIGVVATVVIAINSMKEG